MSYGICPVCEKEYVKEGSFVKHMMNKHEYTRKEALVTVIDVTKKWRETL